MLPAVGYDHPDQSHFTSRHFWEVGATDARLLTGWMGRYLDDVGRAGQPVAGTVAHRLARAGARDGEGAGRGDRRARASTTSGSPGVWGQVEDRMLDAIGMLGNAGGHDPALRTVAKVTAQSDTLRRQLQPFARQGARRRRSRTRTGNDSFPTSLQGLAAMIAAGLPLRCVALEATGEYDTHAEPGVGADAGADDDRGVALRVPARSRGARRRRPGADARVVGVRPARARRTARAGPTTAPPAPGS